MAIDAQENADFYVGVLGMRMVKRTVNQDDPGTYHLFYADAEGHAGSDLTFFIWPNLARKVDGAGQTVEVALSVPRGTLDAWQERLLEKGLALDEPQRRFGERAISFEDPHGLSLALVETDPQPIFTPWEGSPVPPEEQIRGFHGVRMWEEPSSGTTGFLREVFGFEELGSEGAWRRYGLRGGGVGSFLDLREVSEGTAGRLGRGSIHHVAWNIGDDDQQERFRRAIAGIGLDPTPVIDRFWFKSVYFHEPGGALFEAATEGPGFLIDEPEEELGRKLILPPRFEQYRDRIETALPDFKLPELAKRQV